MLGTNPDSLRSCLCFRVFRLNFVSDFFNLLLAGSHQAEITLCNTKKTQRKSELILVNFGALNANMQLVFFVARRVFSVFYILI